MWQLRVGQVVDYFPAHMRPETSQPLAATIARVFSDERVNIGYLNSDGEHRSATSVYFAQPEGREPDLLEPFCRWPEPL